MMVKQFLPANDIVDYDQMFFVCYRDLDTGDNSEDFVI